jgi:phosphohistidine phosphatase SixA
MNTTLLKFVMSLHPGHVVVLKGLIIVTLLSVMPVRAEVPASKGLSGAALVQALRQGGYTIYFRHEATDWSQDDHIQKAGDWETCDANRARQLSAMGRQSAQATGEAMRALGIPFGRVLASPYCRTVETAKLMDVGEVESSEAVINMRVAQYFGGSAAIVATAQALLAQPSPKGSNTLIVAHGNVAQAATPVYPGEGEGVVFQEDGQGGFEFIGRVKPAKWKELVHTLKR